MTAQIIYKTKLRTEAMHLQSGTTIETDAPTDNQGNGERFSPTDLVATALATCMVTTMGIKAQSMGIALDGTTADATKIMVSDPRRIGKIIVHIKCSESLQLDEKTKEILEKVARTCPVERTLHPDVELDLSFSWPA